MNRRESEALELVPGRVPRGDAVTLRGTGWPGQSAVRYDFGKARTVPL